MYWYWSFAWFWYLIHKSFHALLPEDNAFFLPRQSGKWLCINQSFILKLWQSQLMTSFTGHVFLSVHLWQKTFGILPTYWNPAWFKHVSLRLLMSRVFKADFWGCDIWKDPFLCHFQSYQIICIYVQKVRGNLDAGSSHLGQGSNICSGEIASG